MTFADELRAVRTRRRLSQAKLSELADYDHSYLSRLEANMRMPTRDAVNRIADAAGATDDERNRLLATAGFLPDRVPVDPALPELYALNEAYRQASIRAQTGVRHTVDLLIRYLEGNKA